MPVNSASIPALITAAKIRRRKRGGGAFKTRRPKVPAAMQPPPELAMAAPKPKATDKLAEVDKLIELERATGGRVHVGPIVGDTGGRADKVPMEVPDSSYVIPADIVSGLGEGNSGAGMVKLSELFPESKPSLMRDLPKRGVPVLCADGEFVISPASIEKRWGDIEMGHKALDAWVLGERAHLIETLKGLAPPAQD